MTIPFVHTIQDFPDVENADVDGLVAFGGQLTEEWILHAYTHGMFPWFNDGDPVLWWSPQPRMVLPTDGFKVSKSFRNILNQKRFEVSFNRAFSRVIEACGNINRPGQDGTWITQEILDSYRIMHEKGWAHSVEVWLDKKLVGGLYGLAIGRVFFGESMFSEVSNASKIGLYHLCLRLDQLQVPFVDCQIYTDHLSSLGALEMERGAFLEEIKKLAKLEKLQLDG